MGGPVLNHVDAHLHLWNIDAAPITWFHPRHGLPGRADADDLLRALGTTGSRLRGAVLVQAADEHRELEWLDRERRRLGVPTALIAQHTPSLDTRTSLTLTGTRIAASSASNDLSDVPGVAQRAANAARRDEVLEFLVRVDQLDYVASVADRHPDLRVVVCHLALGGDAPERAWRRAITMLARRPNIAAKVSGLVREPEDTERLRIAMDHAFTEFGDGRLMFGSDWPVSQRYARYCDVVAMTAEALPSGADAMGFWQKTAQRVYRL